jgi:hypothetical protein
VAVRAIQEILEDPEREWAVTELAKAAAVPLGRRTTCSVAFNAKA